MSKIKLYQRVKYAGDVHRALLDLGWDLDTATAFVEALPDAEVEPVQHGEWEEWYPPKNMIMTGEEKLYVCSCCSAKYSDVEGYRYCPYCGKLMDGRNTDE